MATQIHSGLRTYQPAYLLVVSFAEAQERLVRSRTGALTRLLG